ncbi:ComEC/Rec2 family competence protein [Sulfurovum sp. XTW-4]|uniref:ComEC/Rec2 family competence protein n=1 Tax=Sulfurovum xiamenensis TaxID=3019066 RepID=A0ABT7QPN3_9BACT|nr:ComEC/Rec2 family competence protein [Sulfurovum xiamenensis]MDM5263065.1 ComEC/Rec2 family competence protein [Sulfurovum xiamenensis]
MQLEKPKLFPETKTFIWVILFFLLVILIRLFFEYQAYRDFISKPFYYTHANVLNLYKKSKGDQEYQVLKLRSDEGLTFYTTNYSQDNFDHKRLRLQIFPSKKISFSDYLGTFYVKSRMKAQEPLPVTFLEKELREKISMLGVSHLVALSGFHLGILWGLVYGLLLLLYRPLQQHFFPYRHALFDVGAVAMLLLGGYLWFVDFPPSLLRSYAMVLVGWMVLLLGMELLSFTFLTTIILILVALFPYLLVSLSFGLSVAGVFYIFLLLQYRKGLHTWMITLVLIPLGIFVLMLPILHTVFPVTSGYQLLSPWLSLLFIPFYPFVMFLHLLGFGSLLDTGLLALFALPKISTESLLPLWALFGYISISIGAIWSKKLFWSLTGLAVLYAHYIFLV